MSKIIRLFVTLSGCLSLLALLWPLTQVVEARPLHACQNNLTVTSTADSGPGSLRQALVDLCDGGTITFAASLANQTITLTSAQLSITKTVTITNPNAPNLAVSGNNAHRVFDIQSVAVVTLSNLKIVNGLATGACSSFFVSDCGGGISVASTATLVVRNGTLSNNSATGGAGIYNSGTTIVIDTVITGNNSTDFGGGIYNWYGKVELTNTTIISNSSVSGGGLNSYEGEVTLNNSIVKDNFARGGGGGLVNQLNDSANNALLTLTNSMVVSNTAGTSMGSSGSYGGGIYNRGTLVLNNSLVSDNTTEDDGGGIYNHGWLANATIDDSQIVNNRARFEGGGFYSEDSAVVTFTNSIINNNEAGRGGGVYNGYHSTSTFNEVTISGNSAGRGGGIGNTFGVVIVNNAVIDHNTATVQGGGIDGNSKITVIDSTISNNTAALMGGGINSGGVLTVSHTTVMSNVTTTSGGGISNRAACGRVMIYDSIISHNQAQGTGIYDGGGGVLIESKGIIENSVISHNASGNLGGGIHTDFTGTSGCPGTAILTNTTVSGNSAKNGGGIASRTSTFTTLNNNTVVENTASEAGGGIYSGSTVTVRNSLVAQNDAPTGPDCRNTVTSEDYNLFQSLSDCTLAGVTTHNILAQDPLLSPQQNNGGSTFTHALLPGSPAIDAGDPATCLTVDQRGIARPQLGQCDIGAFESQGFDLTIKSGDNQAAQFDTPFWLPLAVQVTGRDQNEPIDGGFLTFTAPSSGPSTTFAPTTTVTITNGIASLAVTANAEVGGPYAVTAGTWGGNELTFNLTNTLDPVPAPVSPLYLPLVLK